MSNELNIGKLAKVVNEIESKAKQGTRSTILILPGNGPDDYPTEQYGNSVNHFNIDFGEKQKYLYVGTDRKPSKEEPGIVLYEKQADGYLAAYKHEDDFIVYAGERYNDLTKKIKDGDITDRADIVKYIKENSLNSETFIEAGSRQQTISSKQPKATPQVADDAKGELER
jgi:hypothetical protein